ncbi:MAG: class I SAM-dependent methyltransferase [Aquidulcibacter sp.]|jgi:SAM-dependent methyltransferase|uniref:class I SAM-dependent methyltransferase n=1 Tax=Aquidulcibacter sp. TaxID=2052990 RepID=UPI0022C54DF9|nr:class I SAM-dependent methyltransferase [Aquidulcibacter sp.]MCE2890557.1 class I SAM-dependent methyltransferase [Hyphomonadaceae bacterium]MCZ8209331.1 class I SAM-dependent methyltransferase [Aquidulcibacter sp.]
MRDTIADYDRQAQAYSQIRKPDPRIEAVVHQALGDARTVLNLGAGTGSYEPADRYVVAIEPSATMRNQRPPNLTPAIITTAEKIPYDDKSFDASMAMLTVHHWLDLAKGLGEMRRVTRGPCLVLSFDPDAHTDFWMFDYVPEMRVVEQQRYPSLERIEAGFGGACQVIHLPVALDCTDRFQVALYGRPEAFLVEAVRRSQSAWNFLADGVEDRFVAQLKADLEDGTWEKNYGHLRDQAFITCQLRLIVSWP